MLKKKNRLINFVRCVQGVPFVWFVRTFRIFVCLAYGLYVPSKCTYICERTNISCLFKKEKKLLYVSMKGTFVCKHHMTGVFNHVTEILILA